MCVVVRGVAERQIITDHSRILEYGTAFVATAVDIGPRNPMEAIGHFENRPSIGRAANRTPGEGQCPW